MEFINLFFIAASIIVLIYIIYVFKSGQRVHILAEMFFSLFYMTIMIIFLFPEILKLIEDTLNIDSAINFFLYLSIFVAYLLLFILYQNQERARIQVSRLNREIALMKKKNNLK